MNEGSPKTYDSEVVSGYLIEKLGSTQQDQEDSKSEFKEFFNNLQPFCREFEQSFRKVLAKYNLDPGEIRFYAVGGRVKGTPLKEGSDFDMIICLQNPSQGPDALMKERFRGDTMAALDFRASLKAEILSLSIRIAQKMNLPGKLHILGFGSPIPSENSVKDDTLLIYSS